MKPAPSPESWAGAKACTAWQAITSPDAGWRHQLQADPDALAIDDADARLTRRDLEALVVAEQRELQRQGVQGRDIVAWLGLNSPQMLAALLACERIGAVLMPLNWRLGEQELLACLRHAGVACLRVMPQWGALGEALGKALQADQCSGERPPAESPWVHGAAEPDDLLLVYTSGTTGQPKGAMHTGAQMAANARAAIQVQALSAQDRVLAVLPMFHVGGLCIQVLPALLAGATLRLHPRFEPAAWLADVAAWQPSTSLMVPATLRAVIEHPHWPNTPLSSLRFVNSGSSVVPLPLIEAFHGRGVPVAQVYGSTETGPFSIASSPDQAMGNPASTGVPAPGVRIRLVDTTGMDVPDGAEGAGQVGEIWVCGDNVMRGYHREPRHADFSEGWFHSGDLARRDAHGWFEVVGRSKDMIISGGENIYPAEIENLVCMLPEVAECAVVGLPDERWGEVPVLAVVLHEGAVWHEASIRELCAERLARYKQPRKLVCLPSLPKTALGKVQKARLADALRDLQG